MVQIRKPVQLSDDLIDRRVLRSPRGTIPLSAQAMLARERERLKKIAATNEQAAAALMRLRNRRG